MKNVLFLIVSLVLFSCSKEQTEEHETSKKRIASVLSEKDFETQKLMYSMLKKEEKREIWVNKIDVLINDSRMNSNQRELLIELRGHISNEIFSEVKNDRKEIFKNIFINDFLKRAQKEFSNEFLYRNFYKMTANTVVAGEGCQCDRGSIWACATIWSCEASSCKPTNDGCGFVGMFECTGKCV